MRHTKRWGVVALSLIVSACQPPCLKGHDQMVWQPESCYPVEIMRIPNEHGGIPIYGQQCDPGHWEPRFVCDQYQAEKLEK